MEARTFLCQDGRKGIKSDFVPKISLASWYAGYNTSHHPLKTRVSLVLFAAGYREETVNPFASVSARRRLFLSTKVILPVLSSSSSGPLSLLFSTVYFRTHAKYRNRTMGREESRHCINGICRSCGKCVALYEILNQAVNIRWIRWSVIKRHLHLEGNCNDARSTDIYSSITISPTIFLQSRLP